MAEIETLWDDYYGPFYTYERTEVTFPHKFIENKIKIKWYILTQGICRRSRGDRRRQVLLLSRRGHWGARGLASTGQVFHGHAVPVSVICFFFVNFSLLAFFLFCQGTVFIPWPWHCLNTFQPTRFKFAFKKVSGWTLTRFFFEKVPPELRRLPRLCRQERPAKLFLHTKNLKNGPKTNHLQLGDSTLEPHTPTTSPSSSNTTTPTK